MDDVVRLLSSRRLRQYSTAVLIGIGLAYIVTVWSGTGPASPKNRVITDFPVFYTTGKIVADGNGTALYSPELQTEYQQHLIGSDGPLFLFAYPAYTAFIYVPLSYLPYRLAYLANTLVMLAALALACILLQRLYPQAIGSATTLTAIALTSLPIFAAVFGGQNTSLSLLLVVGCFYNVVQGRNFWAGVLLGLLFYKPQFALPLAGLFFLSGRWRVSLTSGAVLVLLCLAAYLFIDPKWVAKWFAALSNLTVQNSEGIPFHLTSISGFAYATLGHTGTAELLGGTAMSLTIAAISWVWIAGGRRADFGAQMALAIMAIILIAPTLFYDAGLALLAAVVWVGTSARSSVKLITVLWLSSYLHLASTLVGVSLMLVPVVVLLALTIRDLWRPAATPMIAIGGLAPAKPQPTVGD